jgi:hypothetical protein
MYDSDSIQVKETLDAFISQFGQLDQHTQLTLEVLFELIYMSKGNNGKNLSISGEKR